MPESESSRFARARWVVICLTFVLSGCDPLSLLSLFDSPETGASVLTLLRTEDREVHVGEQVEGALSAADYIGVNESYLEAWALEADAGQTISIDLISNAFDSYLYVVGPGLSETLRDDDSGGACHSRLDFTVLEAGVFRVVASSSSSRQAGTYQLRVSEEPQDRAAMSCGGIDGSQLTALSTAGRVLRRGEQAFGHLSGAEASIENDRPVLAWALRGEAGETATIRLESDDYDAYLYFFGPGLTEAMTNDDGGNGLNSELTVTFEETGTYIVGAGALSSGSTGSYSLAVTDPVDLSTLSAGGRLLRVGANEQGMLTDADLTFEGQRVQAWDFEARAGDSVTIDMLSDAFDSYLRVAGPGLPDYLSDDDSGDNLNSRLSVSFPQDGIYRVIASSLGGDTGSFTLRVR
jgi:hypothetical protein